MIKKIVSMILIGCLLASSIVIVNAAPQEEESSSTTLRNYNPPCYGFIVPINVGDSDEQQLLIYRLINKLFQEDIDVFWLASDISVKSSVLFSNGVTINDFIKGSFIIPLIGDSSIDFNTVCILENYAFYNDFIIFEIKEAVNDIKVYILEEPNIAYHAGNVEFDPDNTYGFGIGRNTIGWESYYYDLITGGFENAKILTWDNIEEELNKEDNGFNVFVWGGGNPTVKTFFEYFKPSAINAIRSFVADGGGYVGSCYGSYVLVVGTVIPWNWMKPFLPNFPTLNLLSISSRWVARALPGKGYIKVKIVDSENPLAYGLSSLVTSTLAAGPIFLGPEGSTKTVGTFHDIVHGEETFRWNETIEELIGPTLMNLWYNWAKNKAIWITKDFGEGRAIAFGDHPESYSKFYEEKYDLENYVDSRRAVYNAILYACCDGPYNIKIDENVMLNYQYIEANGPYEGSSESQIIFNGTSTGWTPLYWCWNFGDNEGSLDKNPIHTYRNEKDEEYNILLLAVDENYISYDYTTAHVKGPTNVKGPVYRNLYTEFSYIFNVNVNGNCSPYTYEWDFGDGGKAYEKEPSYKYDETGIFYGNVTVKDKYGASSFDNFVVAVNDHNEDVMVFLDIIDTGEEVFFKVVLDTPGHYRINISFGDGTFHEEIFRVLKYAKTYWTRHTYDEIGSGILFPIVSVKHLETGYISRRVNNINFNVIDNKIPDVPAKPDGFIHGKTDAVYYFRTRSYDSDDSCIHYLIDMGEGKIHEIQWGNNDGDQWWIYKWDEEGEYHVRVKAIDRTTGIETEWSETLVVTIEESENQHQSQSVPDEDIQTNDPGDTDETDSGLSGGQEYKIE